MMEHRYQQELDNAVAFLLSQGPSRIFEEHWELYKDTVCISDPKGIYFRINQDATYRNIAIAGEKGVVDIEADEHDADRREVSFSPYRALSAVRLQMGSILTLEDTEDSLLTVVCLVGTTSMGPYWSAHSEDEVKRLRGFAGILVKEVSH